MRPRSFEVSSSKPQEKCGRAAPNATRPDRNAPIGLHCPPISAAIGDHFDRQQRALVEETMTPRTSSAASQKLHSAQPDGRGQPRPLSFAACPCHKPAGADADRSFFPFFLAIFSCGIVEIGPRVAPQIKALRGASIQVAHACGVRPQRPFA